MRKAVFTILVTLVALTALAAAAYSYDWGKAKAPAVPQAAGFFDTPAAALVPQRTQTFKAIFDATQGAERPDQLLPALDMVGSELNLLVGCGVPLGNAKFVVVFHGRGIDGIRTNPTYRAKFGAPNPNLAVLSKLHQQGVELYVCGQNLASEGIDPKTIAPDVRIASDALIVLMTYQTRGCALLNF